MIVLKMFYDIFRSSDPLEGVLPWGRQGDMLKARSVSHRDFKWRRRCCPVSYEIKTNQFSNRINN